MSQIDGPLRWEVCNEGNDYGWVAHYRGRSYRIKPATDEPYGKLIFCLWVNGVSVYPLPENYPTETDPRRFKSLQEATQAANLLARDLKEV